MQKLLAQELKLGPIGGAGLGPFADPKIQSKTGGLEAVASTVSGIIGVMTLAAGIWFIFQFITGAFFWITSGGDKNKLHEARDRITHALVGLIIVVAAWALMAIVGQFLGIDILLTNPTTIMDNLQLK